MSDVRQISIRVDADMYEQYKAALASKRPRETTTLNLQRHMYAEIDRYQKALHDTGAEKGE